ncbi:MAG: ABC transporter permease [Chloroflexi bacterium]|nr:ABC transporter permease [Chloroflexota bacterium]
MLFLTLFLANIKMLYRNRQAIFWALFFPLIFVVVFGLFRLDEPSPVKMALVDQAQDLLSARLVQSLGKVEFLKLNTTFNEEEARRKLVDGDIAYILVIPSGLAQRVSSGHSTNLTFIYDEKRIQNNQLVQGVLEQFLGEMNMAVQGSSPLLTLDSRGISARRIGYFDFLMPGFVGMGVMTFAIISMASQLALYRQQRILKRIKATPLSVRTFFLAQVGAWLVLSLVQAAVILAAGMLLFGARVYGNIVWMFPLVILANLAFLNLGFIVGSLARTVEAANGLANVVSLPMMFFSGVFFPTDNLPSVLREIVRLLPLTPLLKALRGVLLDAQPPWHYPGELGLLTLWVVATSVVAVWSFRFE